MTAGRRAATGPSMISSHRDGHVGPLVKPLEPGDPREVGRYQLQGRLGTGGMGQVFLGQSPGGRLVAVKLIRADLAADPEFRARFAREVAVARHVSGIFTAPVVDADPDAPQPWLITAYVPGPSLAEAVAAEGPLPLASVLTLAAGLAEGLGAIHAAGLVHRDLKPSNVLLANDGPRIIDFGISRAVDATALTRADFVIGSPGFMSPEQALGQEVGPASDIFSLGAVLAFAAAGEGPFGSGTGTALLSRVVHDPPDTRRLPGRIRPLVERCMAKDPRWRPTTDQLLTELGTLDSVANWLPPPVAQTLSGYVSPTLATAAEPTAPAGPAPAEPASSGPPPPEPVGPAAPLPTVADRPRNPADPTGQPSPEPMADPGTPVPGTPVPGTPVLGTPVPLPGPAAREPAVDPGDAGAGTGATRPLERYPGTTRPRPARRWGRWAAAALVVALALAGLAALALTARGHFAARPSPPATSPAALGPRSVVEAYYAAINSHDWRMVWDLGGKNLGQTYRAMIAGYRMTAHDVLTNIAVHGDRVSVRLLAHETNGTVQTYRASYVVRDGVITAGNATLTGTG
jgi:serine/threonine protein kinase